MPEFGGVYVGIVVCVLGVGRECVKQKLNDVGKDITLDHIFDEQTVKYSWLPL